MKNFFIRDTGDSIMSLDDIIYIRKDPQRKDSDYKYQVFLTRNLEITPYLNENEFLRLNEIIRNNKEENQKKNGRKRYA